VSINHKGNDELRVLSESFNSMVDSIRNHIKKQSELTDELKNVNEQLKHKDRLKDEFINIAAHELRNPIQPIIGLSEVMRSRNVNNDRRDDELLSVIIRNAKRLQRLSGDLLDVTKIESKSLILKKERFNLNNLISDAIEDCKNQIEKDDKQYDNVKLSYTPTQNIFVEADRGRITQVISNLINNAIKFTKKGTITVNADKRANKEVVVISVKDTGTGIDPQIFPQLFTKFATKSAGGSGIGLGLFISKSIVEAHGGRIWAVNNNNNNNNNYNEDNNEYSSKNPKESKEGATFAFSLLTVG
jgi:signal transduction histidine kinase